jgi:hypothetical protein
LAFIAKRNDNLTKFANNEWNFTQKMKLLKENRVDLRNRKIISFIMMRIEI